jgi:Flp pilus assembly CpaE family ATPase
MKVAKTLFDEMGINFEIYLISSNPLLKESLQSIEKVTLVIHLRELESNISCKAIVVDGGIFPYTELKEVRKKYPTLPIFYQLYNVTNEQQTKNIQMICAANDIIPISEYFSVDQVREEVEKHLFQSHDPNKNRIISFFGTHSGAGVSTTVLNVADLLAKKVNEKVLVLSLNPWDPADYFLSYEGKYLSDLKNELKTQGMTDAKLLEAVCSYPSSFYHLAGNRDIKLQRYYKTDEISHLIDVAKRVFDVILIDAGTHFDNAAFAQSYKQSDLKFLVTTQEPKGFRGYWPHIFHQLLEPIGGKTDEFLLIINQFAPDITLVTEKGLSEELDMTILATIPDESLYGQTSIAQKKLLHEVTNDKEYQVSLDTIVSSIVSKANLTIKANAEEHTINKGFFRSFIGKKKRKVEHTKQDLIG